MNVRATKPGYIHNHYKNPGDEFEVIEQEFSHKWMENLDEDEEEEKTSGSVSVKKKKSTKKTADNVRQPVALSKIRPESVMPSEEVI